MNWITQGSIACRMYKSLFDGYSFSLVSELSFPGLSTLATLQFCVMISLFYFFWSLIQIYVNTAHSPLLC